jgi:hypothetical protein
MEKAVTAQFGVCEQVSPVLLSLQLSWKATQPVAVRTCDSSCFLDSCRLVVSGLASNTSMKWSNWTNKLNCKSSSAASTWRNTNPLCNTATGAGGTHSVFDPLVGGWTRNARGAVRQSGSTVKWNFGGMQGDGC